VARKKPFAACAFTGSQRVKRGRGRNAKSTACDRSGEMYWLTMYWLTLKFVSDGDVSR
jgi:hypothetical protein